ncbi:MAG: transcriptional regulator [Planctomycetes bacterium]|nr:transcriptional regulator [Planctomycetota bacterium]
MGKKLNVYRIRVELAKMDKNYTWLAQQMKLTRQMVSNIIKNKKVEPGYSKRIADVLDIDRKDLEI